MPALFQWSLLAVSIASSFSTPLSTNYNVDIRNAPLSLAPLVAVEHPHGSINNSYIVMLKDDLPSALKDSHMNFLQLAHASDPLVDDLSGVQQIYDGHITGYAGRFTDRVVEKIRRMPEVAYVERDQIVKTQEVQGAAPWVSLTLHIWAIAHFRHMA
jgi:cerevisin